MAIKRNRVSHVEFAQLCGIANQLSTEKKLYRLKEIRARFEQFLGRRMAPCTIFELCSHANLKYKGQKGIGETSSKLICPHCRKGLVLMEA